jgi:hypothetical protein
MYCILQYITDSIRLIPLCILLLPHLVVQRNLFYQIQLLGYLFMKHIVRAFVVALVLTGVAATTQTSSASTKSKVTAARTSMLPIPTCPPDDPNACGLGLGR